MKKQKKSDTKKKFENVEKPEILLEYFFEGEGKEKGEHETKILYKSLQQIHKFFLLFYLKVKFRREKVLKKCSRVLEVIER